GRRGPAATGGGPARGAPLPAGPAADEGAGQHAVVPLMRPAGLHVDDVVGADRPAPRALEPEPGSRSRHVLRLVAEELAPRLVHRVIGGGRDVVLRLARHDGLDGGAARRLAGPPGLAERR